MSLLASLDSWPARHIAATLIRADGSVIDNYGDENRVFGLASVTKLLTAYGVLMAVEEGALELDTPLGPEGSTVRHLLAHASGISFDSREPQRRIEERRIYSSSGYEWLADAVGAATTIEFPEYLRQGVFEPLGMKDTVLTGSAGHGAHSTVADLRAFAAELLNPQLLVPKTVQEAFEEQFTGLNGIVPGYGMQKPCPWGLGFEIKGSKTPHWTAPGMPAETVGHFGMAGTYLWVVPGEAAMVMLSDKQFGDWAKPRWSEFNEEIWEQLQQD